MSPGSGTSRYSVSRQDLLGTVLRASRPQVSGPSGAKGCLQTPPSGGDQPGQPMDWAGLESGKDKPGHSVWGRAKLQGPGACERVGRGWAGPPEGPSGQRPGRGAPQHATSGVRSRVSTVCRSSALLGSCGPAGVGASQGLEIHTPCLTDRVPEAP